MGQVNLTRVLLGGVVAGIALFVGDAVVHGVLLKNEWPAVMAALGKKPAGDDAAGMPIFFVYDLLKGLAIAGLYAGLRPRLGPGPRTGAIAGGCAWFLAIPVPLLGMLPMEFMSARFAALWSLWGAAPMALAGIIAGALYKEERREG